MIRLIATAFMLVAPLASVAQTDTGSRLRGHPAQMPDGGTPAARARLWLQGYAACVARRDVKRVAAVIDAPIDAGDAAVANLSQGFYDDCLGANRDALSELRMSYTLFRGALYAERVGRTIRRLTPDMIAGKAISFPAAAGADGAAAMRITMLRFGDCVMRKDPAGALDFVTATASSTGEDKALAALGPSLGGCIDSGSSVKMSRSIIEASLAEAIYRTVNAPIDGARAISR